MINKKLRRIFILTFGSLSSLALIKNEKFFNYCTNTIENFCLNYVKNLHKNKELPESPDYYKSIVRKFYIKFV